MDSRSRWLVGSSSNKTSGLPKSTCAIKTRSLYPAGKVDIGSRWRSAGIPQTDQQLGGFGFGGVAIFVGDDAFELAEPWMPISSVISPA